MIVYLSILMFATESWLFQETKTGHGVEGLLAGILPYIYPRSAGRLTGLKL